MYIYIYIYIYYAHILYNNRSILISGHARGAEEEEQPIIDTVTGTVSVIMTIIIIIIITLITVISKV